MPGAASFPGMLGSVGNLLSGPFAPIFIILAVLLLVFLVVIPLVMKLKRKRLKSKETREIMKDLFTWRHLARLVKGGDEHSKAKEELSDNIVRINELLKQGFAHIARNFQNPSRIPWYVALGEPRCGKSSFLAASDLELVPSAEEINPQEDPRQSLPVRFWTGAKAVVCDISGKVFFDRWLEESGAEWNYIVRQLCRRKGGKVLDGVILAIPADALLADDETLSSKKAVLMANELSKLLRQSGMRLPCYVTITKLDMVSGFQEYAQAFSGDLRHQILGFESDAGIFNKETFAAFWQQLTDRLRSGAKQLLFPLPVGEEGGGASRMDMAGKVWLFPDNFAALNKNLSIYLDILFGKDNFHGTQNTFFEGVYFTSARDQGFSFSPDIAALAGRDTDDVLIPVTRPGQTDGPVKMATVEPEFIEGQGPSTALVSVNAARALIAPYLQRKNQLKGYFIRDLLNRRVLVTSPNAEYVRAEAIRRHIPHYALCAVMIFLGCLWLSGALFRTGDLRASMFQAESYYEWLGGVMRKGGPFQSPLIKHEPGRGFVLDTEPVEGETLSSRLQFYYNSLVYRDLKISVPLSFRLSEKLVFRFDRNMGYRDKAFIVNQLHKVMVRIPVIQNTGARLIEEVDSHVLDRETRSIIVSFVALDTVKGVDFYKFFTGAQFKLDSMIRYLIPDISNDTMELLTNYRPRYDKAFVFQMNVDYIYSDYYRQAKQAGLDMMFSAWRRRDVYPDSIYGKIKALASVSEEIAANYEFITAALNRVNGVSTLEGVERTVFEWMRLTDRYKNLAAMGRAIFEEVRLLMRAAHIPLGFENRLPAVKVAPGGVPSLSKRPALDAFGDNLINDYLFNDMVINYAVREYTRLFETDMEFIKRERGDSVSSGEIIAEQNTFSGSLSREVEDLRRRARNLQNNELLSAKAGEKPEDPSLFMVTERILILASDIPLPRQETLQNQSFTYGWEHGQSRIKTVQDAFEAYVKPYAESEKLTSLIANARVMLLAEAFYNRYMIFTGSLAFLNTFDGNIAAVVEATSKQTDLFSFSGSAIEGLFGGFYYHRGYDPVQVKAIADNVASFVALFKTGEGQDAKDLPLFLRNVDKNIYQPPAFMDYLTNYFYYWGNYPENIYVSAGSWERFKSRSAQYRSFQINSVLMSVYAKSLEVVNQIDDSLLSNALVNVKSRNASALGDRLAMLNQFLSNDAERMFSAWAALPEDPLAAYDTVRGLSEEDLKASYLAVYISPAQDGGEGQSQALALGWWNRFVLDGLTILARESDTANMNRLMENMSRYRTWPLSSDVQQAMSAGTMGELASLLDALGAGIGLEDNPDPAVAALRHTQFRGSPAWNWADTVFKIASAAVDPQKPLAWTLYQVPVEVQKRLGGRGRLLAIDRFRYIGVSVGDAVPRMSSTYMNEKLSLLQGNADMGNLTLQFFRTSQERIPGASIVFSRPWAIFEIYIRGDYVADDQGNAYIPLYFEDQAGRYVYYVAVEFNREIPGPSSWYSSRNWPDLTISGGVVTERRGGFTNGAEP